MALNPQTKGELAKFTMAAKAIIYKPEHMSEFMDLIDTANGAVQAVHTVISAIEQRKPVPPEVAPLLGVNIYMLMVDVAQEATGHAPDPSIIKKVIGMILQSVGGSAVPQEQEQEMPNDEAQEGMPDEGSEDQQMEASEPADEQQEEAQEGTEVPIKRGIIGKMASQRR